MDPHAETPTTGTEEKPPGRELTAPCPGKTLELI